MQNVQHIMAYYFKKSKNATETKKRFVQCIEKVMCLYILIERIKSGLRSFVLEISHQVIYSSWVDQLKFRAIKSRH